MAKPHDGLFHKTFSIPEETASVLKVHLPPDTSTFITM
jgi:hypothetical protein